MSFALLQVAIAGLVAAAATGQIAASDPPQSPPASNACAPDVPDAVCGFVAVPENRAFPNRRTLRVQYAVLPATGTATDDPLVVIPGGPGLGGVEMAAGLAQLFAKLRPNRDIVLIDQRGTGGSNPLPCRASHGDGALLSSLDDSVDFDLVDRCRVSLSKRADLSQYGTRNATLDLEAIRAKLGADRLDILGVSYGTRPALDYLRMFPQRTGQVVIRGAAPHGRVWIEAPQQAQRSLDHLVAVCRVQPACVARFPDLSQSVARILDRLDESPATFTAIDPTTSKQVTGRLSRAAFEQVLFYSLYITDFAVRLPPLIDLADKQSDFGPLVQSVAPMFAGTLDSVNWGMYWSIECDEDIRPFAHNAIQESRAGSFFGSTMAEERQTCDHWPASKLAADYLAPVVSDKEVLVMSGAFDPVAGARWGEEITRTLPNSLHVVSPIASHLPAFPGCFATLLADFLDGTPLARLDHRCVEKEKAPTLKVELAKTATKGAARP